MCGCVDASMHLTKQCVCVYKDGVHLMAWNMQRLCRLTFPPLYSLASRSSLLGWRISLRREINAFWVGGVLSACSRRSIVWSDIRAGQGTSDLAALTHMTQPLTQGDRRRRKLNHVDRKCRRFHLATTV